MSTAIYVTATGFIRLFYNGPISLIDEHCGPADSFYLNCPEAATHIINNEPVTVDRPAPTLTAVKLKKLRELIRTRNEAEVGGFTYLGKDFDSDAESVKRILIAASAAMNALIAGGSFSLTWTCADDSTILLDASQIAAMPTAMAQSGNTIHGRYRDKKAQVKTATTVEAVLAVEW